MESKLIVSVASHFIQICIRNHFRNRKAKGAIDFKLVGIKREERTMHLPHPSKTLRCYLHLSRIYNRESKKCCIFRYKYQSDEGCLILQNSVFLHRNIAVVSNKVTWIQSIFCERLIVGWKLTGHRFDRRWWPAGSEEVPEEGPPTWRRGAGRRGHRPGRRSRRCFHVASSKTMLPGG